MGDREAEYRKRSALTNHDDARRTVDQRPTAVGREPRVGGGPLGHRPRASDLPGRAREGGAWVDPEDDVRIEHSDERLEVAAARGGEERVDDLALAAQIGIGN